MLDRSYIESLLQGLVVPGSEHALITNATLRGVGIDDDRVSIDLRFGYPLLPAELEQVRQAALSTLEADPAIGSAVANMAVQVQAHQVQGELKPQPGIKNILVIASGKGGVGKSTTAVNLALALRAQGATVGLLDADIYGPSQPRMMGLHEAGKPDATAEKKIIPFENHGVYTMSIGHIVAEDSAMIWRGPMVTQALQQLLTETDWPALDYLIVDLPPGTGDIQLTLAQKIPVAGALIVTTPQDIALLDARRAVAMFNKVGIATLGVIENMSSHVCSQCGHEEHIFGRGGAEKMAVDFDLPVLGQLPLDIAIREQADAGIPTVAAAPESTLAERYLAAAREAALALASRPRNTTGVFAPIKISGSN